MNKIVEELWRKIQRDDSASFKTLVDYFRPELVRYTFCLTKDLFLAEEIADDEFVKIWEIRKTLLFEDENSLKKFLCIGARNMSLDALKKNKSKKAGICIFLSSEEWKSVLENHENEEYFAEKIETDEIVTEIGKIIEKMPKKRREIFRLSIVEGMSNKKIAKQMGLTESTVRTHIQLAREEIEKKMKFF